MRQSCLIENLFGICWIGEVKIWYILKFSPFLIDCIVNVNGVKDDGEGSGEGGDEYEKMGFVYRCTDGQQIDIGDSRVAFETKKTFRAFYLIPILS